MTRTLSRRDAIRALAAGGVGLGGSAVAISEIPSDDDGEGDISDTDLATLVALAEAIYPSEVRVERSFVRTYVGGLPPERRRGITAALGDLDAGSRRLTGVDFVELPAEKRRATLRRLGVDRAQSVPDGTAPERILYHLVNSLLYALFRSPRGGELLGIDNPAGYPGGYESFSRHPEDDD